MSIIRIRLHFVWATKLRRPVLRADLDPLMHDVVENTLERIGCRLCAFGAHVDHVHTVASMNGRASPDHLVCETKSDLAKMLKREGLPNFKWQSGYYVASAAPNDIEPLLSYVDNQRLVHKLRRLDDELARFEGYRDETPRTTSER